MPFWNDSKKGKKDEKILTSKSLEVSKSEGYTVHSTSMAYIQQESMISKTTEIHSAIIQQSGNITSSMAASQNSLSSTGSNTSLQKLGSNVKSSIFDVQPILPALATDAAPVNLVNRYKSYPARSAFNIAPLTLTPTSTNPSYQKVYANTRPSNTTSNYKSNASSVLRMENPRNNPSGFSNRSINNNNNQEFRNKLTVKVLKSTKFYDDQTQSKVPTYKTRSKNRGKLLLINNIKFANDNKTRKGAELDEENISQLFKQIGFEIVKYRNLTKKEMQDKIISFRKSNLKKYDIGAVIVMSHGTGKERSDSTEIACTDGNLLQTTWIINEFDSQVCPDLSGKPKIFLFQCCRGDNKDVEHDAAPFVSPRKLCDMLIAYSTVPGFVSHRDPTTGSWYIQAICRVFMEHAYDTDVESLLKIVDDRLADLVANGSKQTSSFENRGFKTCYLHPMLYK